MPINRANPGVKSARVRSNGAKIRLVGEFGSGPRMGDSDRDGERERTGGSKENMIMSMT